MRGLRLVEHGGRDERGAPGAGEQLCGAEEDGGALIPGPAVPVLPGLTGRLDRALDLGRASLVHLGKDALLVVRLDGLEGGARLDLLAADHERDLERLLAHSVEPALELGALGRDGRVRRSRGTEEAWSAHRL